MQALTKEHIQERAKNYVRPTVDNSKKIATSKILKENDMVICKKQPVKGLDEEDLDFSMLSKKDIDIDSIIEFEDRKDNLEESISNQDSNQPFKDKMCRVINDPY